MEEGSPIDFRKGGEEEEQKIITQKLQKVLDLIAIDKLEFAKQEYDEMVKYKEDLYQRWKLEE